MTDKTPDTAKRAADEDQPLEELIGQIVDSFIQVEDEPSDEFNDNIESFLEETIEALSEAKSTTRVMTPFKKLKAALSGIGKTFHQVIIEAAQKVIQSGSSQEKYKPGEERKAATKKAKKDKSDKNGTKQSPFYHQSLESMFNNGSLFAVTLASNCEHQKWFFNPADRKKAKMAKALKRLDRRVQEDLIGRHFHKRHNYDRRWQGVFIFERPTGNIHLHGVLWTDGCGEHFAEAYLSHYWKEVMPSGTVKVVPITDMDGWISYITKYYREDGIKALKADDILFMPAVPEKD